MMTGEAFTGSNTPPIWAAAERWTRLPIWAQEPIFGFGIMQELRRHGYHIGPGTIYPMLHAMEKSGLLGSTALKKDGRVQRAYRATAAGRRALTEAKEKVQELFRELFEEE